MVLEAIVLGPISAIQRETHLERDKVIIGSAYFGIRVFFIISIVFMHFQNTG